MKGVFLDFATVSRDDVDTTKLESALPDMTYHATTAIPDLHGRVADAEVILTNKIAIDRATMAAAPALKLICLAATGTNNVDLDAALEHDIAVCNIRDYCSDSVAQHVFSLILALNQHLGPYQRLLKDGAWHGSPQFCLLHHPIRELSDSTMGIVGYGVLGRAVARMARHFGMQVLVAQRPGGQAVAEGAEVEQVPRIPLAEMLHLADVLSLHCALTPDTRNLIGAAELEQMQAHALLINTARGALVDEHALIAALKNGVIGGAGIDVLSQEPPVDGNPLLDADLPNLIVTPHIAWASRAARQRAVDEMAENLSAFLAGESRHRVC